MHDQAFQLNGEHIQTGGLIGQVIASDPNPGQGLAYAIVQGNDQGLFQINPKNGIITANKPITITEDQTIVLSVEVSDNGIDPLSAKANITVKLILTGKIAKGQIGDENPKQIILESNKQLKNQSLKNTPVSNDFTLNDNKSVLDVSVSGNKVILDIDASYKYNDEIILSYTKGATPILDESGNEIESFSNLVIENNISSIVTSIGPIEKSSPLEFSIYPNPAKGTFTVKAENLIDDNYEMNIYNLSGALVTKKLLYASFGSLDEKINISHMNKGTYIVNIIAGKKTYQSKIVVL